MRVEIKRLTIQNLLSFGNTETVIDFNSGLNLITGPNGAGKSSALLDAISFAWYDKPYRKVNKTDLINRKNKKNLKVSCDFEVNGTSYKIIRGLKNKDVDLEFYIDGVKQNMLSSKGLSQSEIEEHIGIDYKLFKQIISLSINYNKPFLTLPAGEKRELLEKFFSIDTIAAMLKNAKDRLKNLKVKKEMVTQSVDMLSDVLKSEKRHITELSESKKTFDKDKKKELFEITEKIDLNTRNLKQLKVDGRDKSKELKDIEVPNDLTLNDLRGQKEEQNKIKIKAEYDIKNAEDILIALEEYVICPKCKTKLTEDHKAEEIVLQNSIIAKSKETIEVCDKEITRINEQISTTEKIINDINDIKYSIKYLKNQIVNIENVITKLKDDKEKVENKQFVVDLFAMKDEYKQKVDEYKEGKKELSELRDKIKMFLKIVDILSDSGVKSYIFDQLIPVLNKSVNYYLNIFELPIYIEFDNSMKDNIKTSTNFNTHVNYMSFSEGEKKKIDMAILLSFIDVTKKIANWNCNLLVFDELLDSSIDDNGLEKLLESLEKMVHENDGLGAYIISHRFKNEYKHFFTSTIEIKKNGDGFSKITLL